MLAAIRRLFSPTICTVEEWALHNSKKASADGIISAAMVQAPRGNRSYDQ
jgi:hypothetical protein